MKLSCRHCPALFVTEAECMEHERECLERRHHSRRAQIRKKIMARSHEEPAPHWLDSALGPCRIWDGPDSGAGRGGGYPRMNLDGQTVAVHIVNWTNEHGYLPGRKQLDHLCRRRCCIEERHLEPVTHRRNQKRRAEAAKLVFISTPTVEESWVERVFCEAP